MIDKNAVIGQRPVPKEFKISSPYGVDRPELAKKLGLKHSIHQGVDFAVPVDTIVVTYRNGKIVIAHDNGDGLGKRLIIEHDGYRDLYCHLNEIFVNVGDKVGQNQVVAISGNTGNSTAPHLHFEVRKWDGKKYTPVEPLFYT